MSLLNDALKKAKNTQPNASATADGPILRPDFAQGRVRAGNDFLLPALIVIILLLAALLLWQWFRAETGEIKVRARTIAPSEIVPTGPVHEAVAASVPQPALAPEKISATNASAATVTPATVVTNAPVVVPVPAAPAPPPPVTYKLQSIFYRAKNPSTVINGKTLFIGDRVAGAHVTAIGQDSVTILTEKGETKVMELP
ncbi:MAG TPA: hypothetical protein VG754_08680 [Verrucomicrobiae bacterium]|nr:hypothetical protein [Verrucomicrobiae bacterium]